MLPHAKVGQAPRCVVRADAEHICEAGEGRDDETGGDQAHPNVFAQEPRCAAMALGVRPKCGAGIHHAQSPQGNGQLQHANAGLGVQIDDRRKETEDENKKSKDHACHCGTRHAAQLNARRGWRFSTHAGSPRCSRRSQLPCKTFFSSAAL